MRRSRTLSAYQSASAACYWQEQNHAVGETWSRHVLSLPEPALVTPGVGSRRSASVVMPATESSRPTRPTTIATAAAISPAAGSRSASPAVRSSRLTGWADIAGRPTHDRLAGRLPAATHPLRPGPERFFAFVLLAGDRLCYNRLPWAATTRSP